jgi:hypothetical protein
MATSSRVGMYFGNNIISVRHMVKTKYNEYLEKIGKILVTNFNSENYAFELMKGNISYLNVDPEYYLYSSPVMYDEDISLDEFMNRAKKEGCEYVYVFKNKNWFYGSILSDSSIDSKLVLVKK